LVESQSDLRHADTLTRKTGITLKDTGVRDEHGLEPVSGIFSSSPAISVQHTLNDALEDEDEDDTEMQESTSVNIILSVGRARPWP
jgi:centromere protein C